MSKIVVWFVPGKDAKEWLPQKVAETKERHPDDEVVYLDRFPSNFGDFMTPTRVPVHIFFSHYPDVPDDRSKLKRVLEYDGREVNVYTTGWDLRRVLK